MKQLTTKERFAILETELKYIKRMLIVLIALTTGQTGMKLIPLMIATLF